MTKQTGKPDAGRAIKPSNDTSRIASSLAFPPHNLTSHRVRTGVALDPGRQSVSATVVEAAIRDRALRWTFVPSQLLADSAWDMLLELLHAEITERRVSEAILCKAAGVPAGVGRRWINALVDRGLCTRSADGGHSEMLELSMRGSEAMRGYFAELAMRLE